MPQKQVRNVFKEKLGPEELTPSCLPQELSRFPGFCFFFSYLSLNMSCNFILIQMVLTPSPMRQERSKPEELLSSGPSTPGWTEAQGQLPGCGRPGRALRMSEQSQLLVDLLTDRKQTRTHSEHPQAG